MYRACMDKILTADIGGQMIEDLQTHLPMGVNTCQVFHMSVDGRQMCQ